LFVVTDSNVALSNQPPESEVGRRGISAADPGPAEPYAALRRTCRSRGIVVTELGGYFQIDPYRVPLHCECGELCFAGLAPGVRLLPASAKAAEMSPLGLVSVHPQTCYRTQAARNLLSCLVRSPILRRRCVSTCRPSSLLFNMIHKLL